MQERLLAMSDKLLLREYYNLERKDALLTENEKAMQENGTIFLVGKLQEAETRNGNGRIYSRPILEREVKNYQKLIDENRSVGELDHPDDSVINLKNASHVVREVFWEDNAVMGKIQLLNTPSGKILQELVKDNVALGISSRGLGTVSESMDGVSVNDDFQLICFDMVSEPSTPGAYMMSEGKDNTKKVFTKADRMNRLLNEIIED